jgi:hypothetical protein
MQEELGIKGHEPEFLYSYIHSNTYETELVATYRCFYEGDITFDAGEIDEIKFWSIGEIETAIGKQILSDNFEHEFRKYLSFIGSGPGQQIF